MALWISHRVLLTKELIGSRTSRGIPTEMNAKRLVYQLMMSRDAASLLRRDSFMNRKSVLNRDIIQRKLALVTRRPVQHCQQSPEVLALGL
jgi:hypothetical protein